MIAVICEHDNKQLSAASLNALTAASQMGSVTALVVGDDCRVVAEAVAGYALVERVLLAEDATFKNPVTEAIAPTLLAMVNQLKPKTVLAASSTFSKGLLPWMAAKLGIHPLSDVVGIEDDKTFQRTIYAGNAVARVRSNQSLNILTIRTTAFAAATEQGSLADIESVAPEIVNSNSRFVSRRVSNSERPDLTNADLVVSGGRGLGSQENFALIERLADKLGAAVGASRAAVDAGFIANEFQVGQTGKIVAPKLYIAVGISGAIQHLAGMKDAGVIVAINKDADAPIFSIADYGLVGDLFSILPELTDKV